MSQVTGKPFDYRDTPQSAGLLDNLKALAAPTRCPRCDSPAPHLHPAVQYEGEVQICPHEFHGTATRPNNDG